MHWMTWEVFSRRKAPYMPSQIRKMNFICRAGKPEYPLKKLSVCAEYLRQKWSGAQYIANSLAFIWRKTPIEATTHLHHFGALFQLSHRFNAPRKSDRATQSAHIAPKQPERLGIAHLWRMHQKLARLLLNLKQPNLQVTRNSFC